MSCNCAGFELNVQSHVKKMRPGDTAKIRVRNNGREAVVEGKIYSGYQSASYHQLYIGPYGLVTRYGAASEWVINVLDHTPAAKPRMEEPTGLGAVVWGTTQRGGRRKYVRALEGDAQPRRWVNSETGYVLPWSQIEDPGYDG